MKIQATLLLLALTATGAFASPLFTIDSFTRSTGTFFIGVEFNVTDSISVSRLGLFDLDNNGSLSTPTTVGLYSVPVGTSAKKATYLTSATVTAGTTAETIGGIRKAFFADITPIVLGPGNYFIGARSTAEGFIGGTPSVNFLSGTSYVNGWFGGSSFPGVGTNFQLTNQNGGTTPGAWGTALFDSSPVPEPASLMFVAAGLAGLGALRLRKAQG